MTGNIIDVLRSKLRPEIKMLYTKTRFLKTPYGTIRLMDTGGTKPVLLNAPDPPNVIEHHKDLIMKLSKTFRVICFEYPGTGFSYPNYNYDYSFDAGANLLAVILDILKIESAVVSLSCSNGIYGIRAAEKFSNRISHLFLTQTCSLNALQEWSLEAIPKIMGYPFIGQITNIILEKKIANTWYKYALPKDTNKFEYQRVAEKALRNGGCFCLSSLVQSLKKESNKKLEVTHIPATLIWGAQDFTHRKTMSSSILLHLPNCKVIEFENCGHFPEIENTDRYVDIVNNQFT